MCLKNKLLRFFFVSQVFFCSEGTHHDYISYYSGLVLCNTSIFLCVCFFRARFMLSLRDRFCFFSISNSTLLFEQSSHFLTLTVLCRQTKPVNFCWFRFFLSRTSFVERMSSCCLLFSCVCFLLLLFFFCLLALSFFFISSHTTTTPACWTSCFLCLFFSSLFFYYFFLWISTRICCVEHVNDCTPIRR